MFDSPFEFCIVCKHYVVLDQSKKQCAREENCHALVCPLERYFVGVDIPRLGKVKRVEGDNS